MNKNTPLVAAILGAIALILQQYVSNPQPADLKVIGLAILIAALGVVSTFLKGKGASLLGIIGTVGYTFYNIWQSGHFTWNEFILSAALAAVMVFAPTAIPQLAGKQDK